MAPRKRVLTKIRKAGFKSRRIRWTDNDSGVSKEWQIYGSDEDGIIGSYSIKTDGSDVLTYTKKCPGTRKILKNIAKEERASFSAFVGTKDDYLIFKVDGTYAFVPFEKSELTYKYLMNGLPKTKSDRSSN